jgi:hypothetical protein
VWKSCVSASGEFVEPSLALASVAVFFERLRQMAAAAVLHATIELDKREHRIRRTGSEHFLSDSRIAVSSTPVSAH